MESTGRGRGPGQCAGAAHGGLLEQVLRQPQGRCRRRRFEPHHLHGAADGHPGGRRPRRRHGLRRQAGRPRRHGPVRDPDGGAVSGGQTSWASTGRLASGTSYTLTAKILDSKGTPSTSTTRFTTGKPARTFVGYYTPEDGSTVGVGMPVSITFDHPVSSAHRGAVEKAISVTASPAVEVVGHWFSPTRLDFRPEEYWAAGTRVTVRLRLKDVEGADGRYGVQSKDVVFTIGRSQTSVVDLGTRTMTVTRDGKVTQRWKVSGGSPQHTTWGGKMVISEKFLQTRMNSQTVGLGGEYDIKDVPHAQRLTTSGTFIHGNYWSPASVFGNENVSHGCVGLHDVKGAGDPSTPAARFYNSSITGDVVEVRNSGDRTVDPANGLNGWNLSWADWKAGSAL
ncbi:L,D-transpeptidase [Streptacidiphilus monticola]|uniref:Ig-like domain-containing protein n=1 Tax=Streptacidiphilus monticola TaxID=2161674 RepID=A0ABW1G2R8_9ACTN